MGSLWAAGWDEEEEAELQAAASGNASRRLEIERREARGAQRGAQQLREEAQAQQGRSHAPAALDSAPLAPMGGAQLVGAATSSLGASSLGAADPHSVLSVCARRFTGACFTGVHVTSVGGGSAPGHLAPATAERSGSEPPHPPAMIVAEAAHPTAAAAAAVAVAAASTVAAEAAAAAAELAALPSATASWAEPPEVMPVVGSAVAAAAAAEASAAKARPQGRQSAAQLQRRLQAALEMHMTITHTERELSALQTGGEARRADLMILAAERGGTDAAATAAEQATQRRRHDEMVAGQQRLVHEQRLAAERFASLQQSLSLHSLSLDAAALAGSTSPPPPPPPRDAWLTSAERHSAHTPAASAAATGTASHIGAAPTAGAQQALDCLEFTLRLGGGACKPAAAEATEAALSGEARGAGGARGAAGGAAGRSGEVVQARCLADSSRSAPATSAADAPLQLILEGPALPPPRQYTVDIPDGVMPGGSFVALLGGLAVTVPVPHDCELPQVRPTPSHSHSHTPTP